MVFELIKSIGKTIMGLFTGNSGDSETRQKLNESNREIENLRQTMESSTSSANYLRKRVRELELCKTFRADQTPEVHWMHLGSSYSKF